MPRNTRLIVALALIPAIIIVKILAFFPSVVEDYYSQGFYPFISKLFRYTLGWLPFSFGDLVYAFSIIFILRWFIINRRRIRSELKLWLIEVFSVVSVIYIAFHLFWGMNYYRLPLHESLNLEAEYSTEALILVTKKLIAKSNSLHAALSPIDSIKIDFPYSKQEIMEKVPAGYDQLQHIFPHFNYSPKSLKSSLFSVPLTYMGFSGYLNPLTNEAQVDALIPVFKFPTTASHEVAHQLGYAAENEANFIGCLAASSHEDIYFRYSGYAFALRHCLHQVYRLDPELYQELLATIHPGILKNYQEVRDFWDSYKNPTEPLFKKTYDSYLQANNQKDGMKSYSYVVALVVNYFEDKTL